MTLWMSLYVIENETRGCLRAVVHNLKQHYILTQKKNERPFHIELNDQMIP